MIVGYGSKLNHQGTTGFSPCVHLPKFHVGYRFLTHSIPIFDPQPFVGADRSDATKNRVICSGRGFIMLGAYQDSRPAAHGGKAKVNFGLKERRWQGTRWGRFPSRDVRNTWGGHTSHVLDVHQRVPNGGFIPA